MAERERKPIHVTESFLPPKEEFLRYIDKIYDSRQLTNQGPLVKKLEQELRAYLQAPQLTVCANGTLALQLALRHFRLNGKKVITTPFTYVATLSSLLWENCEPVFADIDPETLCLDPRSAKSALEQDADIAGIMPVHVFGNACDVAGFDELAKEHGLKIIYDGAHAFGSRLHGKSLLDFGNASICSFHATKAFHSVEGGCIVTKNPANASNLALLRAFGHFGDKHITLGINAKMSELHAAMGLCVLECMAENLAKRAKLAKAYGELLNLPENPKIRMPRLAHGLEWNHGYFPLIFRTEKSLLQTLAALAREHIHPRRYFYPSLTKLPYAPKQACPIADDVAPRILCLPFWADMPLETAERIAGIVLRNAE